MVISRLKPCPACEGANRGEAGERVCCRNFECGLLGLWMRRETWNALPRREDLREAAELLASFVQALDGSGAYWADTGISDQEHLNPARAFIEKHKDGR